MTNPFDYEAEQTKIKRRRAVADALISQSLQPMGDTQVVTGRAVRNSPLEPIAKIVQAFAGRYDQTKSDEQSTHLQGQYRDEISDAIEERKRGIADPNVGSDTATARMLARIGRPEDVAKYAIANAMNGDEKMKLVDVPVEGQPGVTQKTWMRPGATTGTAIGGQTKGDRKTATDTQGITRYIDTGEQVFATEKPKAPEGMRYGAAGELEAIPAYAGLKKDIAQAGRTQVTQNVSTEKKYGEMFAGKTAETDVSMLDSARKSPELAARANRIKEVLASGKVITGAGAEFRLGLGKVLGLAGASDAETISNTEALSTDLASNTLDSIKASGLGGGTGFSNADRDFLEKAKGGKITLEATTLDRLADLAHRAASLSASSWSKRVIDIPDTALQGTGIKRDPITVPPLYKRQLKGAAARDPGSKAPPAIGAIQDGYRFTGGDPSKKENWEKEK